jgi:hypothetical protein
LESGSWAIFQVVVMALFVFLGIAATKKFRI